MILGKKQWTLLNQAWKPISSVVRIISSDLVECGLSCCTVSAVGRDFTGALATLRVNPEDESMPSRPRSEIKRGVWQ